MRKLIYIAICLIMLLPIGCSNDGTRSIGVSISAFQARDIVIPTVVNTKRSNAITFEMLSDEMNRVDIFDKVNSRYWGVRSETDNAQELSSREILVELDPYQETVLQYPENFPE